MAETVTNILFVCTANRLRRPTAQAVFAHRTDIAVRSAGLDPEAPTHLDEALLLWAEKSYVRENHHREKIRKILEGDDGHDWAEDFLLGNLEIIGSAREHCCFDKQSLAANLGRAAACYKRRPSACALTRPASA